MSGQYSSRLGSGVPAAARVTGRPSAADIDSVKPASSDMTLSPSGRVTRTGGSGCPNCGGSTNAARKSNMAGHFFGFFALTTLPVSVSTRASERSPSTPRSVTSDAFSSSPIIDLTGYRHNETTAPPAIATHSQTTVHGVSRPWSTHPSPGAKSRTSFDTVSCVRIGVVFPQTELGGDVGAVRAYGEAAEALGFTHVLAYDHVIGADPEVHRGWSGPYDVSTTFHEPFVLFGYLAATTSVEL